jgi:hypothetical protein
MLVCGRRAYLEWIGKNTLVITTQFQQKTFRINKPCVIDLVTNRKIKRNYYSPFSDPPTPFFVEFSYSEDHDMYQGVIYVQQKEKEVDVAGLSDYRDYNKVLHRINAWTSE